MAKQPPKPVSKQPVKQPAQQPKKSPPKPAGFNLLGYLLRNLAIVAVLALLFWSMESMNEKKRRFDTLDKEFEQLRRTNQDKARQQELYNELVGLQGELQTESGNASLLRKIASGYDFAIHDVAISGKNNAQEIEESVGRPITREEKFAGIPGKSPTRIGLWPLIDYINKNTPPSAVIYLPYGDSAISNNGKWNYIYDPEWMEYFIYPRLCVTIGGESAHPDLAKRVTHVVIIEGKGYDKLKYNVPVEQRAQEAVLPIDHPPVQNAPAQDTTEQNPFQNKK